MSATASPLVDVADIVRMVGRLAFDRGRGYARTGAVSEVEWDPATERVSGRVQGTGPLPYECHVSLGAQVNGFAKLLRSDCTCPVTGDCKHVAALLLSSNAARLREEGATDRWTLPAGGMPGTRAGMGTGSGAEPTTGRVRPDFAVRPHDADPFDFSSARAMTGWAEDPLPESEPPTWRTVVGALAAKPDGGRTAQSTTMGLQFEVRQLVPRTAERWRGPTTATATGEPEPGQSRRLAVRPVIKNSSGTFVKANVTWASFAHQVNRLGLDPEHHRWFSQFAALHRSTRGAYTGHESDWFFLDDFTSPILWHLLQEAHRIGVALVATRKGTVRVGREAGVRLDAVIDADGAIRLSPVVSIDGELADAAATGPIGDHGLYSYHLTPRAAITIAPMEGRSSEQQRALLGPAEPTVVPPAEIEEFLTDFVPRLRRSIELTSVDGSLPLPAVVPPVLVLTAGYGPKHTLQLDWSWLYAPEQRVLFAAEGASAHDAPDDDVLHDERTERAIVERVGEALGTAALEAEVGAEAEAGPGDAVRTAGDDAHDATGAEPPTDSRPGASAALLGVRARRITPTVSVPWPPEGRTILRGVDAAVFTERILPVIESVDGVRVEIVGTRPEYRELIGDPELTITTVESDKRDWFDLGIVVNLAGYRIPFGPLFTALSKRAKKLLMVDNTYLSLQHPAFDRLRELLDEADALREWETGPRISRYQASLWDDFEDLADETVQALAWRESVAGLTDLAAVPATPLPDGLVAELRPYQLDGYHWLAFLWKHRLGGVLADDMGLGKTLQALAMMAHAREQDPSPTLGAPGQDARASRPPFLVVAPTSVVGNWLVEAARFTPGLVVRAMTTTEANGKETIADVAEGADIVVTSYTLFRLDAEVYREEPWAGLILDEAQFVKNHRAKLHECAVLIDTPFKLAITGTPLENNLMELWSLFAIVAPGLFPSPHRFAERFVRPIERELDVSLLGTLRRRIRPLMMRRTKELVAPELPAKQEQVLQIDLAPAHRQLYDTTLQKERQKLLGLIEDLDRNRFIVFRSLTLLRMLSLDASLVDPEYADIPSSKLDALLEQLDDVVAEGHRSLVFSQFTSFLQKAAARLDAAGIAYEYLDGSSRKRPEIIERFQNGEAPVFLISLKAGGFGLNLTQADYVFLLDPWWNPASESQAIDRTHRIGQTGNVMVYRLVASDTIEEKVMALKARKSKLFDAVLDDDAVFSQALTAEDIRGLLES